MRSERRLIFVALLLGCAMPVWAQDLGRAPAGLDAYIQKSMEDWGVPGLALAVVRNDSVVLAKGYGVREVGQPGRVDARTVFAIGSSSKAFTVAAMGMLVDEGKVKWDDRVVDDLPGFQMYDPWVTREIRLRDLMCHRADVQRADLVWYGTPYGRDELVRRVRFLKPIAGFRSIFSYNNMMFLTAGQVVAREFGESWDDVIRQRIFQPLGMTRSVTSVTQLSDLGDAATPHTRVHGDVVAIPWRNLDNIAPAGAINSDVLDMAQWVRFQLGDGTFEGRKLLEQKTLQEMHSPQTIIALGPWPEAEPDPIRALMVPGTHFMAYGLGWFLQDYHQTLLIGHGGAIDGMRAQIDFIPELKLGLVILTNLDGAYNTLPEALVFRVLDAYTHSPTREYAGEELAALKENEAKADSVQRRAEEERNPDAKPSLPLSAYAGVYTDSLMGDARVDYEDGGLMLRLPAFTGKLTPWHYETFTFTSEGRAPMTLRVTFRIDAAGKAAALDVQQMATFEREKPSPADVPRREDP
jgi:CubicO group peptidase (beta-lactamase class C family)